ncbi:DNA-directed RNA polymerase II subunit RPB1 [Hordeum vulgare]|nr:DNA-directed RNA polymerase II subunit RPB1 [Hordeum vulgare]
MAIVAVETAAAAPAMAAANAESARALVRAAHVALSWVEAIHAKIEDAHAKIFQATSESNMQPMSEKEVEAMEHLLPHEIIKQELEMQEAAEIAEQRDEKLCVAEDEVEKILSIEESAVEYQCELWHSHHYEYYNLEGASTRTTRTTRTTTRLTSAGGRAVQQKRHVDKTSHRCVILHRRGIGRCGSGFVQLLKFLNLVSMVCVL